MTMYQAHIRLEILQTILLKSLLMLLLLMSTAASHGGQPPVEPSVIEDVEFVFWHDRTMPPDTAPWRPWTLPLNTRTSFSRTPSQEETPYAWIRFNLDKPVEAGRYSLYFWRYNLALDVFINGEEIAGSTRRPGRQTMAWNYPLLAEIQSSTWREGHNEVALLLARSPWGGNLAPVLFGDALAMEELWSERLFRQVEINEILLTFGIGLTVVSYLLWALRRNDTAYLWFGSMSLFWSVITAHMVILHNPIPYAYWLPIVHASIDCSIFCTYGFIGRLVPGVKEHRREVLFLLWTLAASASHFVVSPVYFWVTAYGFHVIGIIALTSIVVRVARVAIMERQDQAIIIALAMLVQIALFVHNVYLMFMASNARWEGAMFYAHFGIPLLFCLFIVTLVKRFTNALETTEQLNRELETKVELSRQMMERSFSERRLLEIRQAAESERLKIYRDLHDDVGSKLLSMVHANREGKMGNMALSALESLRDAVSRANNPDQPLDSFLHDIREESELRLRGSGHDVNWRHNGEMPDVVIPSTIAFNLNRILKEVISNIIRHASADSVTVTVDTGPENWSFLIEDNGQGFDIETAHGNGVHNIRSRSREIEAEVNWHTGSGMGTRISLALAMPSP